MPDPDSSQSQKPLRIALVGPCASGKSSLAQALRADGYEVRQPAQEHSFAPDMWQRLSRPDILIFLDVDYHHFQLRRPNNPGGPDYYAEQHRRLSHARTHCNFYVDTSGLTIEGVKTAVFQFLSSLRK
jgi:GTPase SAR1 family protein